MSKAPYKTRTEYVLDAIKGKILSGELKSKEPLRQELLAEEFSVSRIPIREALLQLEAQGLVKFEAHKGAVVSELSVDEVEELFQLRALLEPHALKKAIQKMDEDTFEQSDLILTKLESALDSKSDIEHWSELNYKFHSCLYSPSALSHTLDLIETLNIRSDRYIRLQLLYTDGVETAENEHRQLLKYCQERDTKSACALLKQHISSAGAAIKKLLNSSQIGEV